MRSFYKYGYTSKSDFTYLCSYITILLHPYIELILNLSHHQLHTGTERYTATRSGEVIFWRTNLRGVCSLWMFDKRHQLCQPNKQISYIGRYFIIGHVNLGVSPPKNTNIPENRYCQKKWQTCLFIFIIEQKRYAMLNLDLL